MTYCAEAAKSKKAVAGETTATIQAVQHLDGEPDGSGKTEKEKTEITLSKAIPADSAELRIENAPSVYDTIGISEEELEQIKAELK